jgi:capsular polysaccharide transport system permease protein
MTQKAQKELEVKINKLKESITEEQWLDGVYLLARVKEFELIDLALAFRLMQRVKNLKPTAENKKLLIKLKNNALSEEPDLAQSSSQENVSKRTIISNTHQRIRSAGLWIHPKLISFNRPLAIFVFLPFLIFSLYQVAFASPRYESQAKIIIKEPNGLATLDPAMAIMSGFGVGTTNFDTELVKSFVHSNDMLIYLNNTLSIVEHFSNDEYDFFSRLSSNASRESILAFYQDRISIKLDENSQIISVYVQAFTPAFAYEISQAIVVRAEWYINEIGHKLAKEQLSFVRNEHELVEKRLQKAKANLLSFQHRYDLLDPQAEGLALQQITYRLEGDIALKRTELRSLRKSMSEDAPRVKNAKNQLNSLIKQLDDERSRLTDQVNNTVNENAGNRPSLSVSQILAKFSDYKIDLELSLQAYTSSQISLEKSRIEAYRQLKYLVTVESPTLPEEFAYPEIFYNISLFFVISLMLFGIGKIIISTVDELR